MTGRAAIVPRSLTRKGWAWEFLRRNPEFREACLTGGRARSSAGVVRQWGVIFAEDPDRAAEDVSPIWRPDLYPGAIRILVVGEDHGALPPSFAGLVPARREWEGEILHLLYGRGDLAIQVVMRWVASIDAGGIAAELPANDSVFGPWSRELSRLSKLRSKSRLAWPSPDPRGHRHQVILRALDGWIAGLSQREIATVMFGEERVAAEWSHSGEHLRDRVRRAINRGRYLMNGGYKALLR